ncbi:hypothetical protein ACX0G7_07830 [Flavitalea antarctica]
MSYRLLSPIGIGVLIGFVEQLDVLAIPGPRSAFVTPSRERRPPPSLGASPKKQQPVSPLVHPLGGYATSDNKLLVP